MQMRRNDNGYKRAPAEKCCARGEWVVLLILYRHTEVDEGEEEDKEKEEEEEEEEEK